VTLQEDFNSQEEKKTYTKKYFAKKALASLKKSSKFLTVAGGSSENGETLLVTVDTMRQEVAKISE